MKPIKPFIGTLVLAGMLAGLGVVTPGCTTTDPTTGQTQFDPVKTEKVREAIKPVAASAVRRVIESNRTSVEYFKRTSDVICQLAADKKFEPSVVVDAINKVVDDMGLIKDENILDAKNLLIALYKINYADRLNADLPEQSFAWNLLDVLCSSIKQGIEDAARTAYVVPLNPARYLVSASPPASGRAGVVK